MSNKEPDIAPTTLLTCLGPAGACKWPACTCYDPKGPKACAAKPRKFTPRANAQRGFD